MLSQRQLDANRRNAQLSTGPRTPEGRAAVSLNALRHGLTAQIAVLPNENPEEFRELRDAFFDEYHPAGPTETLLVEQLATAAWRLRRVRALETGLFNIRISDLREDKSDPPLDPRARAFAYDTSGSRSIETLSRYETRTERSFYRALHELQRLRSTPPAPDPPPENNFENQTHSQNRTPDTGSEPTTVVPIEGRDPLPLFRPKHRRTAFSGNHLPNTIDLELLRNEPLQRSLQVPPVLGLDNLAALGPVHHDRHAGVRVTG